MYDAIVVGARCAGSPTALLLARKGYKVLLAALRGNQEQTNRFFGLFAQTVSIPAFFAAENMQQIFGRNPQAT